MSILQNIIGTAQKVEQTANIPKQRAYEQQQRDFNTRIQQLDLESKLREMEQSGQIQKLLQFQQLPPAQKQPFLMQTIRDMRGRGQDTAEIEGFARLSPEQQEMHAQATIGAFERMGRVAPQSTRSSAPTTAAIQEFRFVQGLSPEEKEVFMSVKRGAPAARPATVAGQKGVIMPDGTFKAFSTAKQETQVEAERKAATTEAVEQAKVDVQKKAELPFRKRQTDTALSKVEDVERAIETSLPLVGPMTAGFLGPILKNMGGTEAKALAAQMKPILANIGFEELRKMRAASPTGGALGNVTERELDMLQSTVTTLDQGLPDYMLKANLEYISEIYTKIRKNLEDYAARGYSDDAPAQKTVTTPQQTGTMSDEEIDALLGL